MPKQPSATLLVFDIRRRLKLLVGDRVRAHGLSPQQWWVLNGIYEQDGTAACDLARALRMDRPTLSRVVNALTAQGLVRMSAHPDDRRRAQLHLTARGSTLARALHPLAAEIRGAVEAGLTASERATLRALLSKALHHLASANGKGAVA